ncbi:MAG: ATP-binding protein [Burkholderiaceae bacterium]
MVVGELEWFRRDVVLASVRSVLTPLALMLPLAALGVWWAVRGAVRPLQALGASVAERTPQSLAPLPESGVPPEVLPLVQALNQLLERVARMVEAERRFTADAAHELRTPIAGIRMQAQVALGASDAADRTAALRATLAGCDRATRLVEQLLQLARLETDAKADIAECDMAAVASTVVAWLAPQARQRNQTVALDVAAGVPAAPVGEALAQVLLRNLLDNALRYSPDGSTVRVRIEPHASGGGHLCVEDSGPGMPPEALDRLGERFFRVLGTGQSGSGLGWSIVQRIARLHGLGVQADTSPRLGGLRVQVRWNGPLPHA